MMKISLPKEVFMAQVAEELKRGNSVTVRAKGRSMLPYIRPELDLLIIAPVDPPTLKIGDSVLAFTDSNDYVLHRIIGADGDNFILMGDGNMRGRERCRKTDVLGLLTHIDRRGSLIDVNTRSQRCKALMLRNAYRAYLNARHAAARIFHLIKRLL